ncbi:TPA: FAD-binding oxidoreductase [Burkholderia cepacia ATCC 25416]|uniref:NAD(P)/FAD-dependent oxidoreductase n=1 Tax=Burkholderia cepacia TaxID=292 RepID=UPI0007584415|nr:FAD-binding oxidoreductase [Burkholderia cepacia]HDR9766217.1 FAD-binding oxidoreductase [Burkholderia cepacia ATCC 25416]KWC90145.1 FAD-dependent oxidoreductase [Burkholderia cepacia]MCA8074394.1 FAD-binding oxidoreductase [Burkholderia cepacia]HDR9779372.1 FAD-binding oxidoreductase [Burkholderia cepacia ATCC 25416]HDR9782344.1 FAD-binding oxidoreductase [Burkholderia cepacia ATCC 25416]
MNETRHYDVAIVGGGLVGASAALALTRRGLRTGLFERRDCGAQASGVNYGGVRCQGRPAEQLPLALRARRIWDRLPELIGIDGEFVVSGHLRLARSDADLDALDAYATLAGEHGLPLQVMRGDAFRRRYPWLGRAALGGSLCETDGHANPRLVSPAFARAARAAGADVFEHTAVDDVHHDGTRFHFRAGGRACTATWLINSAGAWANTIAERFGEAVPMEPIYPNMWVTEPLPPFIAHNLGVYGGGVYARQVARGNCVIGGGRGRGDGEFGQPSVDTTRAVMRDACALLPALRDALLIRTWSGVEGCTPDHNPIIGASRTTPRLLHAFGFSGGGFLLAPGVGDVLADLVTTGETATPLDAFSIGRFFREAEPTAPFRQEETHK